MTISNENNKWFSQTTLTFKDKKYLSDGYLRTSISTNSEDYKNFNPPAFQIMISNQISKSCNLNIQQAEELLESFTIALKQLSGEDTIIEKSLHKNSKLFFSFAITSSTNERVVVMEIISSETDATKVIVPLKPTFQSFLRRLKYYVEHYDDLCFNLLNNSINGEIYQIINQLPSLIKGISSQIIGRIPAADEILELSTIDVETIKNTENTILDLDKFMGENMENIKITEIEESKASSIIPVIEVQSDFVNKILMRDLYNLENKLTSFSISPNSIQEIISDFEPILGFKLLNGINESDKKSLIYISSLFKDFYSKSYTINDEEMPSGTPTLKFNGINDSKNIELAKDLLVFIGYIRTVRRRLESKITNAYDNKSMIYILMRCIMDSFCFSYLDDLTKNDIIALIKNRYIYFDSIGVFDKYKQILIDNRCTEIDINDLINFAEEVSDNIINKAPPIDILHEQLFSTGKVRMESKNIYNLEQIVNEIIPMEVNEKLGMNFKDKEILNKIKLQFNISDEIINIFTSKQKEVTSNKMEKITPLKRWVEKFKQDIPERYRDNVVNYVKDMGYNIFDFSKTPWELDEFDERIIKALYVWDPKSDEKMKADFEYFASLVESEVMTKESILISSKIEKSDVWNNIAEFV